MTRFLLLLLPLVRTVRKGAEQIEENYTEPAFDWSSVFAFIKWVLVVAGAVAVIILAAVGILILIEVYKANRSYLRSIRHKSYRAAVRGTVREMVEQEMEFARAEMKKEVRREVEAELRASGILPVDSHPIAPPAGPPKPTVPVPSGVQRQKN